MRKIFIALILSLALPLVTPVFAQTPPPAANAEQPSSNPVVIPKPEFWIPNPAAWEEKTLEPNDYRFKAYTNPQTESSIEVFSKKLEHVELANTLFSSFDRQLATFFFEKNAAAAAEMSFTTASDVKISGSWNEYAFINRDIRINTITFSFTLADHAFIIVGYFSPAEREAGIDVVKSLIKAITLESGAEAPAGS